MSPVQPPGEDLSARLARFPVARYPVQHATTQFHLGTMRLAAGDVPAALEALTVSRDVFARVGMRLEHAKATNMLGVALRSAGRRAEARAAFEQAVAEFAGVDSGAESAAAAYNLGLVCADLGDRTSARAAWERARALFLVAGHAARAGAATREWGAALLADGQVDEAQRLLAEAVELADQGGDTDGYGAAANVLGLAHLAAGRPHDAVEVLRRALGAFPRGTRPGENAMAKANLALAHEQVGDGARARLAARQALALAAASAPVRAQAHEVLTRIPGRADADLLTVLDDEVPERWPFVLREELLRLLDSPPGELIAVVRGVLDRILHRPASSYALAQALLQVVLELPPQPYAQVLDAVVAGCAGRPEEETERLRGVLGSAMARFAIPQWQRLAASLNAGSARAGMAATWR